MEAMESEAIRSKRFLYMVIHDLRGPTVSTKQGLEMGLGCLRQIKEWISMLEDA